MQAPILPFVALAVADGRKSGARIEKPLQNDLQGLQGGVGAGVALLDSELFPKPCKGLEKFRIIGLDVVLFRHAFR